MITAGGRGVKPLTALVLDVAAATALAGLLLALHAESLSDGLFMDDYAHHRQLRQSDWSLRSLVDACRLELVGGVAQLWFLRDCTLRFFRPVAFALMKATYVAGEWNPFWLHVASLAWHLLVCVLIALLLHRLSIAAPLAWGAAALFAVHPAVVVPVRWIACQTELMATALVLAAAHCYLSFRDCSAGADARGKKHPCLWALLCMLFYAAALGCRENTVVFPAVMLAAETTRWRSLRSAVGLYVGLAVITAGYLALRSMYLGGAALPPRPYFYSFSEPGFVRFVIEKLCYYLLGEFFLAPIVPFAGQDYLRRRPLLLYGLALGAVALIVLAAGRRQRQKAGLLAPAWLLGFMLPVLPVFASPHHLYLPAVGWAGCAALILQRIGGVAAAPWLRQALMYASLTILGAGFTALTASFGVVFDIASRVEDQVVAEMATADLHDGDTLYVANLPVIAHYARYALEERTGCRDLRVCVLTWAPRVLGLVGTDLESELTWLDEHTCEIRLAGDCYFSGALRQLLFEATGSPWPRQTPESAARDGFAVLSIERQQEGVSALRLRFDRPPGQGGVHLFWGSTVRWACELSGEAGK
jgi:hypothetical protein